MKILLIANAYPDQQNRVGGVFVHEQALALKRIGISVAVMTIDLRKITSFFKVRTGISSYEFEGIAVYRFKGINYLPKLHHFHRYQALNQSEELFENYNRDNGRPDLIHAHFGLWSGYAAKCLSEKYSIPYVVTEHTTYIAENKYSVAELSALRKVYDSADNIITVSRSLKDLVLTITKNKSIDVIYNLINPLFFNAENSGSGKYIFSLGNLIPQKRFDILIKAFAMVSSKLGGCKLIIGGEGYQQEEMKQLVKSLRVEDKVSFTGRLTKPEVVSYMEKAALFALTSDYETFGVVFAEAMACGLPVVATRCGGPEEYVSANCGIVCEKGDVQGVANAIIEIYEHRSNFLGGKENASMMFSETVIARQLKQCYEKILQ